MKKWLLAVPLALFMLNGDAVASGSLAENNISTYASLDKINSAEYKFLLDPQLFSEDRQVGYQQVWDAAKALAEENGYATTDNARPYKEKFSTKEYFDTKDYALRNRGYIIRKQSYYKDYKPTGKYKYTGKFANPSMDVVVAKDFTAASDLKASMDIEENVSLDAQGNLKEYTDISQKIKSHDNFENALHAYESMYPKLSDAGLPGDTPLIGYRAYSHSVVVGEMDINGNQVEIEVEVWAKGQDDAPFVGEISYTLEFDDYMKSVESIKKAEAFLVLEGQQMQALVFPNFSKFNGSKVRVLMNLPVE